ncbi:hypothetical protein FNU76_14375 [Chitinimonas arctica]|uniref:Uncharacterized protein n=1 Tax=Chitinimonas arctica TaxID=2594795 RepID=A0A516SH08_9NEIS|nr:hypothetical protein [Chitinimonas arctica]QDQ27447.1 hypothetical protein FNU76_14375 [Chitinimonas arctica]
MGNKLLFQPAAARHLHLALADAASGTPRQWWHLEIAARLPAGPASPPIRLFCRLLNSRLAGALIPTLSGLGLPGLSPYRLPYQAPWAQRAVLAALLTLCVVEGLLGMDSRNASRQLAVILLALFGGALSAWQAGRAAGRERNRLRETSRQTAQNLPASEAALGLAGLLSAAGMDYPAAQSHAEQLALAPDSIAPDRQAMLGLHAPAAGHIALAAAATATAWLAGVAAVAWSCWLAAPAPWQAMPPFLGLLLVHFVAHGQRPRWWGKALLHGLAGMGCWFLPKLLERLATVG